MMIEISSIKNLLVYTCIVADMESIDQFRENNTYVKGRLKVKNYYLLGMKGIRDCNNQKIQLEYYMSELNNNAGEPVYGIRIIKCYKEEQRREKEESFGISKNREEVERLTIQFVENEVTPSTLLCLVDEYMTKRQRCYI